MSGLSKVLYPGSFDPLHNGHLEIIEIASRLFDEVIVVAMVNRTKEGLFPLAERVAMMDESVAHLANVSVGTSEGLVVDAADAFAASFVAKGLRTPGDFEAEIQMAHMNKTVSGMETVFIPSGTALGFLSSRYIREISTEGRDVSHLVPVPVAMALKARAAR